MKRPPVALKDSESFARSFTLLGPIVVALAWTIAARSHGWWSTETLQVAGVFGQFLAFAMLSWKPMHFDKAKINLDECNSYDNYLDECLKSDEVRCLSNSEKVDYFEEVRECRQLNRSVAAISRKYQLTNAKMLTRGFVFFTCATIIILAGFVAT